MKFCKRPFTYAYFGDKGEVWPCGWMHYTIGNLYEQNIDEIWHGEAANKARQSIVNGSFAFCRETSCPFCERGEWLDLPKEEIARQAVPTELPLEVNMANDHICNIACTSCRTSVYCPREGEREKIDGALKRFLPFANKLEALSMNGGGEFLANPSFIEFLRDLRPENDHFRLGFETNGILFDETHWQKFSHLGKYQITVTVTLNSLRREVYRYLSGGFDHMDRVKKNLKFLSNLRRSGQIDKLNVTMVVQECNFWEVPDYIHTFTKSDEYAVDEVVMKPLYKWWKMDEETYWFKNILNPMHPYHKEYLKILADDCWNDPKVYDWGCHNIREPMPHPLKQEEIYRQIMAKLYGNSEELAPQEYVRKCLDKLGAKRVGFYGKNEFSQTLAKLLREAGAELFQLTWVPEDCEGEFPKVAKQDFKPDMADAMIIIDFFKGGYWFKDLRALGFEGPILTAEKLIEGENT